jgi:hypothetical protein
MSAISGNSSEKERCTGLADSGIMRQMNIGKWSLTSSTLPVGRGVIAAPFYP